MDTKDGVNVESFNGFIIPLNISGYYREYVISNCTNSDIVVIGNNNGRTTIAPDSPQGNGTIVVMIRSHNGHRHINGAEQAISTERYTIPKELVEKGYYYLKEQDILIATPDVGKSITHPNAVKSYDDLLDEITASVKDNNVTKLLFNVNDPMGRAAYIYGCIDGHCFKIPCTKLRNKGACTLTMTMVDDTTNNVHHIDTIEELFELGSFTSNAFGSMLSMGVSANDAIECHNHKSNVKQAELSKVVSQRVATQRKTADEEQEREQERHKLKLEELKVQQDKLKHTNSVLTEDLTTAKHSLDAKDKLLNEWNTLREYKSDNNKRSDTEKVLNSKLKEQEQKTNRARWQASSEATKILVSVATIVVSAIVGAVVSNLASSSES